MESVTSSPQVRRPLTHWLRRSLVILSAAAGGFYVIAAVGLYFYQNRMIYFPRRYDAALKPGVGGLKGFREYRAADGKVNYGYLIETADESLGRSAENLSQETNAEPRAIDPADRLQPMMYLVFLGNASTAMDGIDDFERLANATGIGFFLVDYRGYGFNDGSPSEAGLIADALGAYDTLAAEGWFDQGVGVIGVSIGGGAAFAVADSRPVDRLVTIATFSSIDEMARGVVGWPLCLVNRNPWRNDERLARILARPADQRPAEIIMFHGAEDTTVPHAHGERLAQIGGDAVDFRSRHGDHESVFGAILPELKETLSRQSDAGIR